MSRFTAALWAFISAVSAHSLTVLSTVSFRVLQKCKKIICQKLQQFWSVFQCLALPKDRQSFCEVQKKMSSDLKKDTFHMNYPKVPKMQKQTLIPKDKKRSSIVH